MQNTEAQKIINNYAKWSVGAGLLPVPLLDFGLVTTLQLEMVKRLCLHYQVPYQTSEAKTRVLAVMGGMAPRLLSSIIKVLPVIGTVGGLVAMPALSGASTYAVGQVLAQHFEQGGTLENFDISKFADYYHQMQLRGKELAALFAEQIKASEDVAAIANIEWLKNKGLLTPDEYDRIKKRWHEQAQITITIS